MQNQLISNHWSKKIRKIYKFNEMGFGLKKIFWTNISDFQVMALYLIKKLYSYFNVQMPRWMQKYDTEAWIWGRVSEYNQLKAAKNAGELTFLKSAASETRERTTQFREQRERERVYCEFLLCIQKVFCVWIIFTLYFVPFGIKRNWENCTIGPWPVVRVAIGP